eukprot:TRINITY_DN685_c0_g1_i5.p1 TRINITY_DN685_c0_g1~~TRINITY_DN685_c0_g1_i5.p1  ORF type:complete len:396 (-),score=39.80 TRINITY_DN685_c0_g1_i5:32-1042(-)
MTKVDNNFYVFGGIKERYPGSFTKAKKVAQSHSELVEVVHKELVYSDELHIIELEYREPNGCFPLSQMIQCTTQFSTETVIEKIKKFNQDLINEGYETLSMSLQEVEILSSLAHKIENQKVQFTHEEFNLLSDKLLNWPLMKLFPVLDIARQLIIHPNAANYYYHYYDRGVKVIDVIIGIIRSKGSLANRIMATRFIQNMFNHPFFYLSLYLSFDKIEAVFAEDLAEKSQENPKYLNGIISVMLNYSLLFAHQKNQKHKIACATILAKIQNMIPRDDELVHKIFVALGTLIFYGDDSCKQQYKIWNMGICLRNILKEKRQEKLLHCIKVLLNYLEK